MSRQTRPMKFLHCNGSLFSCHLSSASEEISEEMALLHKNEVNLWRLNQWTCMKINPATLRAIYWLFMMSCTYFKGVGIRRFISNLQSVAVAFNRKMSCSLVGKGEGWQRKEKRQTDLLAKKALEGYHKVAEDCGGDIHALREWFLCDEDVSFPTIHAEVIGPFLHLKCYIADATHV